MRWWVSLLVVSWVAHAQTVSGFDPHVFVTVQDGGLLLQWNALADAGPVVIRSGAPGVVTQPIVATLDAGVTWWFDGTLDAGARRIYRVQRTQAGGLPGEAVVLAGLEAPFTDDPGRALVVIDRSSAAALRSALDQYEADLRDDGFEVEEAQVERTEAPPLIKARIALQLDSARPLHVVLLGAVPRVFSGFIAPDGHPDHSGAWPADSYYADLTGLTWTDTVRGGTGAFFNDAGDGKFDQSSSSAVEAAVGRVDFEGMPVFGADAGVVLLGRYLDKVHQFRSGDAPLPRAALVRPNFGYFNGEAFGRAAYRDATAILGVEPVNAPFFPTLEDAGVLLAWGDGAGSSTSAGGVTTSSELAMRPARTRVMALFGSYFGDWNYTNNLLRAALGSGLTVASYWYARPQVQMFALGALESFGQAWSRDTTFRFRAMGVHQALLGDPTLRLWYPLRMASLTAQPGPGVVTLQWPSFSGPEPLLGYHVFRRAPGAAEQRLTPTPITQLTFSDVTAAPDTELEWRVVAVVRETTGSGTFWNHSLGARAAARTLPVVDAGIDAGVEDAGVEDAGVEDAGVEDAGVEDAGVEDAGVEDAGVEDAGVEDAGSEDAGVEDAGTGAPDAGPVTPLPVDPEPAVGGCQCAEVTGWLWVLGAMAMLRPRRRAVTR